MGHGMPHRQPEQHSMSRLLELFSTSQDMIYGNNHLDRASETLDGTADHEMPSCPSRHSSASRLFDSFSTSGLAVFLVITFTSRFLLSAVTARVALCLAALFHVVILTWTDIDTSSPCKAHARFQD